MALIKCEDCGKEHSEQAEVCPNCGRPSFAKKQKLDKEIDNLKELREKFIERMKPEITLLKELLSSKKVSKSPSDLEKVLRQKCEAYVKTLNDVECAVFDCLSTELTSIDDISLKSGKMIAQVLQCLTLFEVDNMVEMGAVNYYKLI